MDYFDIEHLSVERLLSTWRWLISEEMALVARNAFGDLFVQNKEGSIFKLDVSVGNLTKIAGSKSEFGKFALIPEYGKEWFAQEDELSATQRGLQPKQDQCIAFKIPLIFRESEEIADNAYVGDLYEYVSFLGGLHRQLSTVPDGGKINLTIGPEPKKNV